MNDPSLRRNSDSNQLELSIYRTSGLGGSMLS